MKKNVKALSFTLVLMMLLTSMIACAGNKEPEVTTPAGDGGVSDATTTPEVVFTGPGDAYEKDDLPKDKKWDDEIYLFTWSDQLYWEFEATTETGDTSQTTEATTQDTTLKETEPPLGTIKWNETVSVFTWKEVVDSEFLFALNRFQYYGLDVANAYADTLGADILTKENTEMIDLICEKLVFDSARIFGTQIGVFSAFREVSSSNNWIEYYVAHATEWSESTKEINRKLGD